MTNPDLRPTTVSAVAQLYAAERTAGQDIQRLDFMIFSILLAYIGVVTGWFINADTLPPIVYSVVPLPVVGLVAYLVQLMDLAKVRGTSIDYLEGRLRTYAEVDAGAPLIGSEAEKSVTDIGAVRGGRLVKSLRVVQAVVLYGIAVAVSATWVVGCLITFRHSVAVQTSQPRFSTLGEAFFWLTVVLGGLTALNIVRVMFLFGGASGKKAAAQPGTTAPDKQTPDGKDQAGASVPVSGQPSLRTAQSPDGPVSQ